MKRLLQTLMVFLLVFISQAYGQDRTISGTVTGREDGLPLPGVSVVVTGTQVGTQTSVDGRYTLKVPAGSNSLTFTYIGYTQQKITIGASDILNVSMVTDATQLGEVVVTALGIERTRNQLPYAVQQVSGAEVSKTRANNFISGLSGKVAGLELRQNNTMGGSVNVVLRGNKSFTGTNQALFVVDGVPIDNTVSNTSNQQTGRGGYDYGNPAADINPDNIASVTVLKGAAASVLYGSRAVNGVVLITTKKGTKGLGITVNSGVTLGSIDKTTFLKYQKSYGAGYGSYYESSDGYFLSRDINDDGVLDLVTPLSEDASYGGAFDPNKLVYQWDSFDPNSPNFGKATPYVAAANDPVSFFESPTSFNNSIFIDGGGENGYFKLGYTRSNDEGILANSKIDKDIANLSATYNITSKLTAGAAIDFTRTRGLGRYGTGYDDKNLATNFRQWWQTNVDLKAQEEAYMRNRQNITWNFADPSDLVPIYWDNPYFTRYENFQNDERNRYFGNVNLNYKVTNWLNVLGRISLDSYSEQQEERQAVGSVTTSNYSRYNRNFKEFNYDFLANFNKDITSDIGFTGLIGTNIRKSTFEDIDATTEGGLVVPRIYSLSNSLNPIPAPVERLLERQVNGIFAGATFNYKEFITLDLTGRRDQSSALPEGNNVYYYPAISGSFLFSKLMSKSDWLSNGKVRLNYAEVGNDAPPQSLVDVYFKPSPFGSATLFSVPGIKNNPDLKPERTKSIEAGLEMSFLNDRFGFDATLYKANTVDQILPVSVSNATGYNSKYVNSGDVENRGIELSLFGTPIKTDNFTWNMNVNWTKNQSKVLELYEGTDNLVLGTFQGGVSINATVGQPFGTIRGSNFTYVNGQRVVGPTGYYETSSTSNQVIGNANPNWIAGINNNLKFKDISLGFLIDIRNGGDVFSLDRYYGLATGMSVETAGLNDLGNPSRNSLADGGGIILPGVLADGTPNTTRVSNSNYGLYGYARNPAAGFVYDAGYVKLREVILTYSLPGKYLANLGPVKGVDFSVIGKNLWIIDKNLPDADPEDNISAGNIQGYQGGSYPAMRNVGFNVKLRF
ncbi:SusC/RagA family TonB-linked outer membrane protein [Daejeonella oryzae]|uniref:SusC/RagA family TonB-linked outer membrane protein n=1 Tax=Daejeonella oryzae TaxID=1122943 RepID=UPI00047E0DF6|nr:SusC/RagA family TonB-linked outer membrane protein [Daejeonella oryzae]